MLEMADQVNVYKFLRTLTCLTIPTKCGIRPMPVHKKHACAFNLFNKNSYNLWVRLVKILEFP